MVATVKPPAVSIVERSPSSESSISLDEATASPEELMSIPSCFLSCLDSTPGPSSTVQSAEVPFKDFTALNSFAREHDVDPAVVLRTAWALVLRCYLGANHVGFGLCEVTCGRSTNDKDVDELDMVAWAVDFDKTETLHDVLKAAEVLPLLRAREGAEQRSTPKLFNTALAYLEIEHQGLASAAKFEKHIVSHDFEDVRLLTFLEASPLLTLSPARCAHDRSSRRTQPRRQS